DLLRVITRINTDGWIRTRREKLHGEIEIPLAVYSFYKRGTVKRLDCNVNTNIAKIILDNLRSATLIVTASGPIQAEGKTSAIRLTGKTGLVKELVSFRWVEFVIKVRCMRPSNIAGNMAACDLALAEQSFI